MGGAGGYTCMSEDAQGMVEDFLMSFSKFESMRGELMVIEVQMAAKAMALQTQGLIPLHTDPDWVNEAVQTIEMAGLRSKGTEER